MSQSGKDFDEWFENCFGISVSAAAKRNMQFHYGDILAAFHAGAIPTRSHVKRLEAENEAVKEDCATVIEELETAQAENVEMRAAMDNAAATLLGGTPLSSGRVFVPGSEAEKLLDACDEARNKLLRALSLCQNSEQLAARWEAMEAVIEAAREYLGNDEGATMHDGMNEDGEITKCSCVLCKALAALDSTEEWT
jgi:hypothetical protein